MVLIEYVYVRSAAIYCIKKRFRIEIYLHFLQYLLVIRGHLWYTEEEDPEDFCPVRAKDCVYAVRCICRQKGSSNSVHDFRKGIQVQTKAQPVKTGVAKPNGPKRRFFLRMAAGCQRYFVPPCRAMRAVKGVFYLEVETARHSEIIANPQTHDLCGSLRSKLYRQRHHR